jgi:hypothetical protein
MQTTIIGPQGFQGGIGAQGRIGTTGSRSGRGAQGNEGLEGQKGFLGKSGTQGKLGQDGQQGFTGAQMRGLQGKILIGQQGFFGMSGQQGPQPMVTFQGKVGFIGPQGHIGAVGQQGIAVRGPQGSQGLFGQEGYMGQAGTGEVGMQGMEGAQGQNVTTSSNGFQGLIGQQGPDDAQQGAQGITGTQGNVTVSTGVQGSRGLMGPQGALRGILVYGYQYSAKPSYVGDIGPTTPYVMDAIQGPTGDFIVWMVANLANLNLGVGPQTYTIVLYLADQAGNVLQSKSFLNTSTNFDCPTICCEGCTILQNVRDTDKTYFNILSDITGQVFSTSIENVGYCMCEIANSAPIV